MIVMLLTFLTLLMKNNRYALYCGWQWMTFNTKDTQYNDNDDNKKDSQYNDNYTDMCFDICDDNNDNHTDSDDPNDAESRSIINNTNTDREKKTLQLFKDENNNID